MGDGSTRGGYGPESDDAAKTRRGAARAEYNRALAIECEFWRQKAAVKWLKDGDANTSFFHAEVRQRRSSNFIARIKDVEGRWLDDAQRIKASATAFYAKLFSSEATIRGGFPDPPFEIPTVDSAHNNMIQGIPTVEEIRQAVFSMDANSAPGPDGFGVGFYQKCWEVIKDDLWRDFRTISLCNVSSKIISKILASRINTILPKIISPWQTGFVPGRDITDNIMLAQEMAQELDRRLKAPNLILKLDMEKAYDRVEWPFLLFMLRKFGFSEQVVDLCFRTFSNAWFSILINGEPSGYFKSSRGVRQGDPLSPTLFLFIAEFLGRGLHDLFMAREARFFKASGSRVPYLAFADDTMIFTRCSRDALAAIQLFLEQYQSWSGQKVNPSKSSFSPAAGTSPEQLQLVQSILGFQEQRLLIRYLGVPLTKGRMSCVMFDGLLARLRQRLFHWSSKLLTMGVKLSSSAMYLTPSRSICSRHYSLLKRCWSPWAGSVTVFFGTTPSRIRECTGQPGRKFASRWVKVDWALGHSEMLFRVDRPPASWRRLMGVRDFAEGRIRWCLGEGLIDFWWDRWCTELPLAQILDMPHAPMVLVGELYLQNGWDVARLRSWLPDCYVSKILPLQIFPALKDQMVWKGSSSGDFSVSSALEGLRQKRNESVGAGNSGAFVCVGSGGCKCLEQLEQQFSFSRRGVQGVSSLLVAWFLSHRKVGSNHIRVLVPLAALWFIWRSRNQARFEGVRMRAEHIVWEVGNLMELLGEARKLDRSFQGDGDCIWARERRRLGLGRQPMLAWTRPPEQGLKLNTDASVTAAGAFGGGVVRSSEGKMIFAFSKEFGEVSVVHAEALAVLAGLALCQERVNGCEGRNRLKNPGSAGLIGRVGKLAALQHSAEDPLSSLRVGCGVVSCLSSGKCGGGCTCFDAVKR
nr:uncharacterized protein LOC113735787 [Coffea arabica]